MKKLTLVAVISMFCASLVQAESSGVTSHTKSAFLNYNSTVLDSSGQSWSREIGVGAGALYVHSLGNMFAFRTGLGLMRKSSSFSSSTLKLTYLEVPVTLMYGIHKDVGIYGGVNLDFLVNSECTTGCAIDRKSFGATLEVGGRFNLVNQLAVEPYVEFGMTDIASKSNQANTSDTVKLKNGFGARVLYNF